MLKVDGQQFYPLQQDTRVGAFRMNFVERVQATIMYTPPDQIPIGEFIIEPSLAVSKGGIIRQQIAVARRLELDAVCVPADEEAVKAWAASTDCFLFALVDGPFETFLRKYSFMEGLQAVRENPEELAAHVRTACREAHLLGEKCIRVGAHGIMLADDIAYNGGLYLSPTDWRCFIKSPLAETVQAWRRAGIPVFYHSDGDIRAVMDDLVEVGFIGLQGLEPGAGMDVLTLRARYGLKLCFMGGIDTGQVLDNPAEAAARARELATAGQNGGIIIGTCGGLVPGMNRANLRDIYRAAREGADREETGPR